MADETTSLRRQVRQARGKFAAMAASYSLGVFNDQFYKEAAMLLAVSAGKSYLQNVALAVFTLPYLIAAAPAGWLADRFPKRTIVIAAKALEVAAMGVGAVGILTGSWPMILTMVATMGLQSAIFSPSLNGSIPELYPPAYVPVANGVLKMVVTAMILLGVASAGYVLDWRGRPAIAVGALAVALVGLVASFGVPRRPAAAPGARFPWTGPAKTFRVLASTRKDPMLAVTIAADAFVWCLGAVQLLLINVLAIEELGYTKSRASSLKAAELLGVAVGGLVAGKILSGRRWFRVLAPAATIMGVSLLLVPAAARMPTGARFACLLGLFCGAGLGGGLFMIPCESFIQVRPAADRKGEVIAAANFVVFAGILLATPVTQGLYAAMPHSASFAVLGGISLAVAVALWRWKPPEDEP